MVLACLSFVRQGPEDYNAFLAENSIKVPASLRQGFHKASLKRTNNKEIARRNRASSRISSRPRTTTTEGGHGGSGGGGGEGGVGSLARASTANTGEGRGAGRGGGGQGSATAGDAASDGSDDGSETWSGLSSFSRDTTATGSFLKEGPAVGTGLQ